MHALQGQQKVTLRPWRTAHCGDIGHVLDSLAFHCFPHSEQCEEYLRGYLKCQGLQRRLGSWKPNPDIQFTGIGFTLPVCKVELYDQSFLPGVSSYNPLEYELPRKLQHLAHSMFSIINSS